MNINDLRPRLRRGIVPVVLAVVLGLVAAVLTQCRMVGDTVTGSDPHGRIQFSPGPFPTCIHACNDAYRTCHDTEEALYKANKAACDLMPSTQRKACMTAEKNRHKAVLKECVRAMQACKKACKSLKP